MPEPLHTRLFHSAVRITAGEDALHYLVTRPVLLAIQKKLNAVPPEAWNLRFGDADAGSKPCEFLQNLLSEEDVNLIRRYGECQGYAAADMWQVLNLIAMQLSYVSQLTKRGAELSGDSKASENIPTEPASAYESMDEVMSVRTRLINASRQLAALSLTALTTPASILASDMKLYTGRSVPSAISSLTDRRICFLGQEHNAISLSDALECVEDARHFLSDLRLECGDPERPRISDNHFIAILGIFDIERKALWDGLNKEFHHLLKTRQPIERAALPFALLQKSDEIKKFLGAMHQHVTYGINALNSASLRLALGTRLAEPDYFLTARNGEPVNHISR